MTTSSNANAPRLGASGKFKAVCAVLAALAVAGIAAWVYQLMGGLGVTGMNNGTSWGLYIAMFMFFVGLSAGGLIVASSASVFHVAQYKKVALPAVVLSTVCICCASMFILIDLGGVQRVWQMLLSPNFASPLMWDMCVITLYLVVNIVYLRFMTSKKPGAEKRVAVLSRFALPIAILVHSVTAWIFGLEMAKEGWYSAIMAPLFVVSAMDSGLALLLLSLLGLDKAGWFKTDHKLIASLAGLLATCVAIDAFLVGCEVLTMAYPGASGAETLAIMATGATAPFFWAEVVIGLLVPFCILVFAKNRVRMGLVALARECVVAGVLCKRIWLLLTSFATFNVAGAPGVAGGSSLAAHAAGADMWVTASSYAPTWVELVVVVGVISLGALAFLLLARKLVPAGVAFAGEAASRTSGALAVEGV